MTTGVGELRLQQLDRAGIQRWLPDLSSWLLPAHAPYGVQHTWPQLYRSDGRGEFLGLFGDDQLVSHVAWRLVGAHGERGPFRLALLGSVATAPHVRGRGHASAVLNAALLRCRATGVDAVWLWAERPELYARAGFVAGSEETMTVLAQRPHPDTDGVRPATVEDHAALHALHQHKPWRVERSPGEMSLLLTTPGLSVMLLEREHRIVAYACCGKGSDLQGWWHEVGGRDADVAALLPGAMARLGQRTAPLLLPPYRTQLLPALHLQAGEVAVLAGPMVLAFTAAGRQHGFVDGLDSV